MNCNNTNQWPRADVLAHYAAQDELARAERIAALPWANTKPRHPRRIHVLIAIIGLGLIVAGVIA